MSRAGVLAFDDLEDAPLGGRSFLPDGDGRFMAVLDREKGSSLAFELVLATPDSPTNGLAPEPARLSSAPNPVAWFAFRAARRSDESRDSFGTHIALLENKNPRFTGALRADDGTRTHDLLHGKGVGRFATVRIATS